MPENENPRDFNLQILLSVQLLTYETMSENFRLTNMCVCNLLRNFVCLISTDMFPSKFVDYNTSSCAYSHTKRHVSAHFLTYKDMYLRYI